MKRRCMLSAAMLALAVQPQLAAAAPGLATPTAEDLRVLTAVIAHFCARDDIMAFNKRGVVAIAPDSDALWHESTPEGHAFAPSSVSSWLSPDTLESFHARNQRPYSMRALGDLSPCARVVIGPRPRVIDPSFDAFKTWTTLKVPGYSKDGRTAFASLGFSWSIHGAVAIYLLRKEGERWVVVASDLRFFV